MLGEENYTNSAMIVEDAKICFIPKEAFLTTLFSNTPFFKKVNKVLVEGKEFFDGDSKLATQNIPANAIDKVQVLKNYNEVTGMRGVTNNEDNIALNIKLKKGKDKFWFGEVNVGGGVSEDNAKYIAKPKLFYYSPTRSVNILADFNNIGEVPFTFRDYFNFTGGFRNFNRGGGTNFNIRESDLGFAVSQNNQASDLETKFVAGNFSLAATKKLDVSGFAIFSDNKTTKLKESRKPTKAMPKINLIYQLKIVISCLPHSFFLISFSF